ncbi:MAG: trypsin-like peptidase domain-containing protein [Gammaproteobacteria bacterium]|jgi:S1-C subfamily serine protease|nr:trypsin-like peptidase domain-containing protein [Gammaproteobacteria bacterium]
MNYLYRRLLVTCYLSLAVVSASAVESDAWRTTLEKISSGVVSIKIDSTRAFDTEWNQSSQATGFVVDAEQGLILTNRHVVTPGPVRAEALFKNQEEVELTAIYRDPVHDFGFYRYDPEKLKYIVPEQLELVPSRAEVGREITVVGNDAGEQLSFLSGTLARLDRPAPDYGNGNYNDFNTFYLQAASATSGGSSGSPVVDIDGNVVALNAGGSGHAASSFFLPLDRVKRAFELLQTGKPVTRGTLATTFVYESFDELRRLGLREGTEASVRERFPGQLGMLVVDEILPNGVADGRLMVGDIIVEIDGEFVTRFVQLEDILDSRVGESLRLIVERNGQALAVSVDIQDLHAITPMEYIQFGDAVVHKLSYQQARHMNRAPEGVYIANPGYVFGNTGIPRGSVITAIGEEDVRTLDDFETALDGLADRDRARVRFYLFENPFSTQLGLFRMERRWYPAERCRRNDDSGLWPCRALDPGPAPTVQKPATASYIKHKDKRARKIAPSLVLVNYDMPYTISGIAERHYYGTGLVVDAKRGFIVVDRNTIPEAVGDVQVTFAGALEVQGKVEYIHPLHNLALLSYDPALIGDTPVRSADLLTGMPDPGDSLWAVGLRRDNKLVYQATEVASVEPVLLPLSRTMRFRETNLDALNLINGPTDIDGVLVDVKGRVIAMWSSFVYQAGSEMIQENKGIPIEYVEELLGLARDNRVLHSLEVEWSRLPMSVGRKLGLDNEWIRRFERHDPERRQILSVLRTVAGSPAAAALLAGDVLLSIDGVPVTRFRGVELAVQHASVTLEILRDGQVRVFDVATVALEGLGVRRAVLWAGALLQAPYREMLAQRGVKPYGVYIAYFAYGSPASRYGLFAGRRIIEVDGMATPDLDRFLEIATNRFNGTPVRITTVNWNNSIDVLTLKLDETYWPAYEIVYREGDWQRIPVE